MREHLFDALLPSENPHGETTHYGQLDVETVFSIRRPEVMRFLIGLGVDVSQAEDITQEVFLRALDETAQKRPIHNLFHWLLSSARNLAFNQYRRARREQGASPDVWSLWEAQVPDSVPNQETHVLLRERYQRLARVLSSLTDKERQCLVLRSQGLPFREIAKAMDMPLRTVANVTAGAISKLRSRLHSYVE